MKNFLTALLVLTFFTQPSIGFSQDADIDVNEEPDAGAPGPTGNDPGAPIDGGVSFLVAAGVGYGVKKWRDNKKNKI